MLCPICEENDQRGQVQKVRIDKTGEIVQLCDECDSVWPSDTKVSAETFQDFSSYVKPAGLQGLWSEITPLTEGESS
jgi:hypothetical protein